MKNRFVFFCLLLTAFASMASAQLKIAPEAGANLSSVNGNNDATDNTIRFTGKIGAQLQVPIDSFHFFLQPGLFYSMQGQSLNYNVIATNYIQLPVNFVYKIGKRSDRFFVGAGLYAAYAVVDRYRNGKLSEKLPIGNTKNDVLKPFDFGGDVRIGHELYNGLFLAAQYSFGFINTYPGPDNTTVRNWVLSITAGYYIPLRKEKRMPVREIHSDPFQHS
jgi:hypothetical protein